MLHLHLPLRIKISQVLGRHSAGIFGVLNARSIWCKRPLCHVSSHCSAIHCLLASNCCMGGCISMCAFATCSYANSMSAAMKVCSNEGLQQMRCLGGTLCSTLQDLKAVNRSVTPW